MLNIKLKDLIKWADENRINLDEAHIQCDEIHFHRSHFGEVELAHIKESLENCNCILEQDGSNSLAWTETFINLDGHQWNITIYT